MFTARKLPDLFGGGILHRFLVTAGMLITIGSPLNGDETDPVKTKLDEAKTTYKVEVDNFRKAVAAHIDQREQAARDKGDKPAVDQIKAERQAFMEKGELPKTLPVTVKQKAILAKSSMEAAYTTAIKEYTKTKKDVEASAVEKELDGFKRENITATIPFQGKEPSLAELFQIGTIWAGIAKWTSGPNPKEPHNWMIVVTERTGNRFVGIVRWDFAPKRPNDKGHYDIEGTVRDNEVEWGKGATVATYREGKLEFKMASPNGSKGESWLKLRR